MTVLHVLNFAFSPEASEETVKEACQDILDLAKNCINPTTQNPYIKSVIGGKDINIEGTANGYTHVFIVEFETIADRDYYIKKDQGHLGLAKKYMGTVISKGLALDFVPGEF